MFKQRFLQLTLAFGDISLFVLALFLSLSLRQWAWSDSHYFFTHLPLFSTLFATWVLVNYVSDLYDLKRLNQQMLIETTIKAIIVAFLISISIIYLQPKQSLTPKLTLLIAIILAYTFCFLWRFLFLLSIKHKPLKTSVLLIGYNEETQELLELLAHHESLGYNVRAILPLNQQDNAACQSTELSLYRNIHDIKNIIQHEKIQLLVTPNDLEHDTELAKVLYDLLYMPVSICSFSQFYEQLTGRVPLSSLRNAWLLQHLANAYRPIYQKVTWLLTVCFTLLVAVVFMLSFPIIAILIKRDSKGPIFFKQQRIGHHGRVFWIYKYRTMQALTPDGGAEPDGLQFTQKNDVRITQVGQFLRKTRFDELPQVLNLLKGDIGVIGPRPERPEIIAQVEGQMPQCHLRHIVKPGLTGWAQVQQFYADDVASTIEKNQYDLYYIKNRSLLLDLSIYLKTISVVLNRKGQ